MSLVVLINNKYMKVKQFILFLLAMASCVACNEPKVDTASIKLTPTLMQLSVGEADVIEAEVTGAAGTITWESSDESVATVMAGIVTAKAEGETTVTARIGSASATCMVFVVEGGGDANFSINKSSFTVEVKKTQQLSVVPETKVTWSSADAAIATVDQTGLVTGVKDGKTQIVATDAQGRKAQSTVIVIQQGGSYQGEYKLIWADEFDGTSLNTDDWNIEVNGQGGGNGEAQYYTDRQKNLRIEDGCLIIEAHKEDYQNKSYTSGRIQTKGKHEFAYVKVEARIWLPSGQGTWPAFWMLGNKGTWPTCGEIDIMEHVGSQPTMISHALHTRLTNGTKGNNWSSRKYIDGMEGNWHTFGVEILEYYMFTRDAIRFTIDGEETAFTSEPTNEHDFEKWPFYNSPSYDNKFYIILNLALGGSWGGSINTDIFPVQMKVDWVRVYKKSLN